MKIRPVGAEFFHKDDGTDGRTDGHDEANSRFSQFRERAYKALPCNTLSLTKNNTLS
jgi:hypothetical protein